MTLTDPDRLKFERLKQQAELKAQWVDARLKGEPWPRQLYRGDGYDWLDLSDDDLGWREEIIYRRKPEPTLEERNAELKAQWDAMPELASFTRLNYAGKKCVCEWLDTHAPQDGWRLNTGGIFSHPKRLEYRIRELPSPRIEPYTFETCPLGAVVAPKLGNGRRLVVDANDTFVCLGKTEVRYEYAMTNYDLIPDPSKPDERRPFGREVAP